MSVDRVRKLLFVVLPLLILFLILWPVLRSRQLENSFSKVKQGDTKDMVVQTMGKPWKAEACGEFLGGKSTDCTEEFVFANPYAPYIGVAPLAETNS
jgi:hypothetical protein